MLTLVLDEADVRPTLVTALVDLREVVVASCWLARLVLRFWLAVVGVVVLLVTEEELLDEDEVEAVVGLVVETLLLRLDELPVVVVVVEVEELRLEFLST